MLPSLCACCGIGMGGGGGGGPPQGWSPPYFYHPQNFKVFIKKVESSSVSLQNLNPR